MAGIKELKEVIAFGMAVGSGAVIAINDDGKITLGDATAFTPAVIALPAALEGITEIPVEIADLDEAEFIELQTFILETLPAVGDKWLVVAKESLNIGLSVLKLYNVFK